MTAGVQAALADPDHQDRVLVERLTDTGEVRDRLTYAQVAEWAGRVRSVLTAKGHGPRTTVGLVAGNGPEWIVADLALLATGATEVPVPLAFSADQAASLLEGVDICLVDEAGAARLMAWGQADKVDVVDIGGALVEEAPRECAPWDPAGVSGVVKVIHTSGTTGTPKGVRIRAEGVGALLESLAEICPDHVFTRYLSLVPLSLLIEQVTAVYLPIINGGRVVLLPDTVRLLGTAGSRAQDAVEWLARARPTAAVLPPAVVSALDKEVRESPKAVDEVLGAGPRPFLMCGGAPVDADALRRLDAAGLRIHEGYGLSENSSVVTWNTPGHWRPGTVGRPLPHCEVRLSEESELLVRSTSLFAGYTVEDPTSHPVDTEGWLHTGDRARIDEDGFVHLLGRLRNTIITSHGRNVSPEWVEGRLRSCSGVADAIVLGNGLEHLIAVVVAQEDTEPEEAALLVENFATEHLSEIDRPERYIAVSDGREFRERYFTVTGRPRRDRVAADFVPIRSAHPTRLLPSGGNTR